MCVCVCVHVCVLGMRMWVFWMRSAGGSQLPGHRAVQPVASTGMVTAPAMSHRFLSAAGGKRLTNTVYLRGRGTATHPSIWAQLHPSVACRLPPFMGHGRDALTDGTFLETSRGLMAGARSDAESLGTAQQLSSLQLTNGVPLPLTGRCAGSQSGVTEPGLLCCPFGG